MIGVLFFSIASDVVGHVVIPSGGSTVTIGRGGPTPEARRLLRQYRQIPRAAATAAQHNETQITLTCLRGTMQVRRAVGCDPSDVTILDPTATILLCPGDTATFGVTSVGITYRAFVAEHFHKEWLVMDRTQLLMELSSLKRKAEESTPRPRQSSHGVASYPHGPPADVVPRQSLGCSLGVEDDFSGADFADAVHKLENALLPRPLLPVPDKKSTVAYINPSGAIGSLPLVRMADGPAPSRAPREKPMVPPIPLDLLESQVVVYEH